MATWLSQNLDIAKKSSEESVKKMADNFHTLLGQEFPMGEIRVHMTCVLLAEAGSIIQNANPDKPVPLSQQLRDVGQIASTHISQIKIAELGLTDIDKWREIWCTVVNMLKKSQKTTKGWSAFSQQRQAKANRLKKPDMLKKLSEFPADAAGNFDDKMSKDRLVELLVRLEVSCDSNS